MTKSNTFRDRETKMEKKMERQKETDRKKIQETYRKTERRKQTVLLQAIVQ